MRNQVRSSEPSRTARAVSCVAWLLTTSGVLALAWCAVVVGDMFLAQRAARLSLESVSRGKATQIDSLNAPSNTVASTTGLDRVLHRGSAIAALVIPRVHLSAIVLHGSDDQTLRRGPGHLESSALPGETGNAVIAGHRDSFFRPLRHIKIGDDIFVDTPEARSHYRVTSLWVVRADDLSVIRPETEPVLTLITCFPFWVLGSAPDRFVVRARRVDDESVTPAVATVVTPPQQPKAWSPPPAAADDEGLIRESIERFRVIYNGRLDARNELRAGGPLRFAGCDVVIADGSATATCDTASEPANDFGRLWTFALRHDGPGWAVTSITTR
jgi:sortase A